MGECGWVGGEAGYKAISASTGLELELELSLAIKQLK